MRNYILLMGLVAGMTLQVGLQSARADDALAKMDGDVIGKVHFVGIDRIAADPKAAKLNELGALPATAALRDSILSKLATAPFRLFSYKLYKADKNDFADLLQPLVNDLLHNESYTEVRGPTNSVPEVMVAVHLDNDRQQVWGNTLSTVLTEWTGCPAQAIKGDGFKGWELKKHHDPNVIRFIRAGDWVLFGWGWDDLQLQPRFLELIKQKQFPVEGTKDAWLEALLDWPSYQAHHELKLSELFPAKLPKMHLSVEGRKDFIRPTLTMDFPAPLDIKLEPWRIPTNVIPSSIVSFTAARGVADWLGQLPEVKQMHANPVPNQFTVWALDKVPFETHLSVPVQGASNYLAQIAPGLMAELNGVLSKRTVPGEAVWTNGEVHITQIPFLAPYLRAIHDPTGDYLSGGLFPSRLTKDMKPVPQALIHEVMSKPKLVYYDWEINQTRIEQWHQVVQVSMVASGVTMPNGDLATEKWLEAAGKLMGNCGTEVSLTAPNELTLVRNGPVGLTGFEMNELEYWMDSKMFPFHPVYEQTVRLPGRFLPPAPH